VKSWLKYIIEVFVIMFSILAAFWLEEYREERKERKLEIAILKEIRDNLREDIGEMNEDIGYLSKVVRSSEIVLEHLNNDLPYNDSLSYFFSWLAMSANHESMSSGYELMLSTGSEIISNDTLRQQISKLYSSIYPHIYAFLKDRQYMNNQPLYLDMLKRFKTYSHLKSAIPRDYEALKTDEDFKVNVMANASMIDLTLDLNINILKIVKSTIAGIEKEITRLSGE